MWSIIRSAIDFRQEFKYHRKSTHLNSGGGSSTRRRRGDNATWSSDGGGDGTIFDVDT